MHPQYEYGGYDFALMKLTNPATLNGHVGTICLPESTEKLPVGTVLWETGWGQTSHGGPMSDVLKELEVVIVPRDIKPWYRNLPYSEFLTTATQEGHGTCRGDSGGPVVHERNGRWYLEGVHSWGRFTCAQPGRYDGQADVRTALPWITDTIKNN
ncbi:CUB and peptidase domain-containing protein 1-like [Oculina patagonica]